MTRAERIESIVNYVISSHSLKETLYALSDSEKNKMLCCVKNEINEWKGVGIGLCKSPPKTYKEYANKGKNWLNQNKSRIYGDHFFVPVIFEYILKV